MLEHATGKFQIVLTHRETEDQLKFFVPYYFEDDAEDLDNEDLSMEQEYEKNQFTLRAMNPKGNSVTLYLTKFRRRAQTLTSSTGEEIILAADEDPSNQRYVYAVIGLQIQEYSASDCRNMVTFGSIFEDMVSKLKNLEEGSTVTSNSTYLISDKIEETKKRLAEKLNFPDKGTPPVFVTPPPAPVGQLSRRLNTLRGRVPQLINDPKAAPGLIARLQAQESGLYYLIYDEIINLLPNLMVSFNCLYSVAWSRD